MYWRPRRVSRTVLMLISFGAVSGLYALHRFPDRVQEPFHQEKLAAAQRTSDCFKVIRAERLRRGLPIDLESDPASTGLIGSLVTTVTTNAGSLTAKQTSVNPNYAAIVVRFLKQAGLGEGDVVAVGFSGSFPAFNIAVLAAVETLKLKPLIISSASSSQWGANDPEFLWLDMEHTLFQRGLISKRSIAASIGGIEDRGLGMKLKGRRILEEAIGAHGITLLDPKDFQDSIEQRLALYHQAAGSEPIRAYINVGGGAVSVGRKAGKRLFRPGVNKNPAASTFEIDSLMGRFTEAGIPVVHLVKVRELAEQYGFPIAPTVTPNVGEGRIFHRERMNLWLVGALLFGIVAALYLFVRSDLGFRIARGSRGTQPEPMV